MPQGVYAVQTRHASIRVTAGSRDEAMSKVRAMDEEPVDAHLVEYREDAVDRAKAAFSRIDTKPAKEVADTFATMITVGFIVGILISVVMVIIIILRGSS